MTVDFTVTGKVRQDGFLAEAQEAQDQADKAKDSFAKNSWQKIADSYRDLTRPQGAAD
jgi:hypothetical protein